ncbi:hypothetical protein R3P38DRAFT_3027772 [Favolaschia claudopus]|uniref:Secreted protein n=1 Tax=Favolaschia claudopus TaxID=2862362 RepID=A0AAW0AGG2_9AGAR
MLLFPVVVRFLSSYVLSLTMSCSHRTQYCFPSVPTSVPLVCPVPILYHSPSMSGVHRDGVLRGSSGEYGAAP